MSISALAAAKTICELGDWEVSNLQLQKILYITHMAFMGENKGAPLIEERFEAWEYGPVVPSLYYKLRHYGSKRIRVIFSKEDISGTPEEAELKRACDGLLSKEVSDLVAFTHRTGGAWG